MKKIIVLAVLVTSYWIGFAQGFVNLGFENATFISDPSSGYYPSQVYATNAIPGWTAYVAGGASSLILSNSVFLSGGSVSIIGTNWVQPQIEGKYFMLLAGFNYPGFQNTAGVGQTGQIPANASTLFFWGILNGGIVSFNGQTLVANIVGGTPNYNIYAANIAGFSGQTGELLFTTALGQTSFIDNIQFSTVAVPEPASLSLLGLGGLGLWLVKRRQKP